MTVAELTPVIRKAEKKFAASTGPVTIDVDEVWAQMLAGATQPSEEDTPDATSKEQASTAPTDAPQENGVDQVSMPSGTSDDSNSEMVRIRRTYNFAGKVHTEEKLVARESAEAKLYLASLEKDGKPEGEDVESSPPKRILKKAFRSAFEPIMEPLSQRGDLNLGVAARMRALDAARDANARKLNTVEKSRMDWAGYVDKEGIKDELELASKSKDSYTSRQAFLARSEALREEDARKARMATRV
jgi:hypothetical protein